jgi:cyclopropane fatty-acyl-phospholipid synthase-like methyltransferase
MRPPYRNFPYPLNVLMHVIAREGGSGSAMHYGVFAREGESLGAAQERSTELLFGRLPPPPRRVLEVGTGLGATLDRLTRSGYAAVGITPDPSQAAEARRRFGEDLPVRVAALETFEEAQAFEVIVFQESSQYIPSAVLWDCVRRLCVPSGRVIVLDEFALRPVERANPLPALDAFIEAARAEGFRVEEEVDLSREAAPTVSWFLERLPRHRRSIEDELAVSSGQVDELVASGEAYRELYGRGDYGYRLLAFREGSGASSGLSYIL